MDGDREGDREAWSNSLALPNVSLDSRSNPSLSSKISCSSFLILVSISTFTSKPSKGTSIPSPATHSLKSLLSSPNSNLPLSLISCHSKRSFNTPAALLNISSTSLYPSPLLLPSSNTLLAHSYSILSSSLSSLPRSTPSS